MYKIILASQSKPRKLLLNQLNLEFDTIPANIDESQLDNETPLDLVERLSIKKATTVANSLSLLNNNNNYLIISSDQVAVFNNKIYGKPVSYIKAVEQLKLFNNNIIKFITGLCVLEYKDNKINDIQYTYEVSKIKLKNISKQQISNYLHKEQPYQSAASFKLEGLGICLIETIDTKDYNAIIGLPILKLINMLDKYNYQLI